MRSKNRMYIFFITLALIFWNPLVFYFIYSGTPVYALKLIHFLFWFVFACGICILYLLFKNKTGNRMANIFFSGSIAGILFSFIVLADGIIGSSGRVKKINKAAAAGLIFEPGSKLRHHTFEFNYVAKIDSLGLRDKEMSADKGDKYRILCFGDSWTYGWGVDIENSWPKKLELFLKGKGIKNIEVINCGQPGRYTTTYKKNIEKVIPVLKPDLVLLGVLQLDDLAQLYEEKFPVKGWGKEKIPIGKKIAYAAKTFLSYAVKNILALTKKTNPEELKITATWKNSVRSTINNFSPAQQVRYNMLDDSVKILLRDGNLTPGILYYFINRPNRVSIFNNPGDTATRFAISEMNKDLEAIRSVCDKNNSGLIFINLPGHYFTGHNVIVSPADSLNSWFEHNNKIDSLYRSVALKNTTPYFELTAAFRALEDKSGYFFRYDGHPNERGYQKMADLVGQYLIDSNGMRKNK